MILTKWKKSIGEIDYILDNDSNIISVKWNDNSAVTLLSSCHGVEPVKEAKRWSDAQKKHILVPQPLIVNQYNYWISETDQMDKNIENARIHIRIKKWTWSLFCFVLEASVHNAWCIYTIIHAYSSEKMWRDQSLDKLMLVKYLIYFVKC